MSKNIVSIHAYDCLDNISATAQVRQYSDYDEGPGDLVLRHSILVRSEGITDPREWLGDVLLALLEAL